MSAPDAQSYWISRRISTDQFLLYCFDKTAEPLSAIRQHLVDRAATIDDLSVRVREVPGRLDFPHWVPMTPGPELIRLHENATTWHECLTAVAALHDDQLDSCESPWRLHLFGSVTGVSGEGDLGGDAPCVVAVLQVAHALADGRRSATIARDLFGSAPRPARAQAAARWRPRRAAVVAVCRLPVQICRMVLRARPAHLAHRQLERDTATGLIPVKPPSRPRLLTNGAPDDGRTLATVVVPAADLRGAGISVTVGAMTAVSLALTRYLRRHGDDPGTGLAAEVTVAKPGKATARNHFRNVTVDLHPDLEDVGARAVAIAESLRRRRLRADHPAGAAEDRALDAVPAPLLRHGIDHFDFTVVPDEVTGNTVVSSVDRGPADLVLGGGRVRSTAGFPALSQHMGLTHGVHGIGDRVTISVATSPAVMPDLPAYERLLGDAVVEVAAALVARGVRADSAAKSRRAGPGTATVAGAGTDAGPATQQPNGARPCRP